MNKNGQTGIIGFTFVVLFFVFLLVLFSTIDPFKENLDNARNTSSLNCLGTDSFNQTAFDDDASNQINRLTRRPTCFVTGLGMVYFIFAFMIASLTWVVKNWRKFSR